MKEELEMLLETVYSEGCAGGIIDYDWFTAYANHAIQIIKNNVPFDDEAVISEYHKIKSEVLK
ncbi:MAG: hypothetical protein EOM05_10855 [Clostridia bacterium]|nr:hypothetical protein [Clostridia bacterium]